MINTPEQKINGCSMPDSGTQKNNHLVDNCAELSFAVSPKRDVQILQKPSGKGHMPSSPEFPDRATDIWIIKVFLKVESEHPSQTNGHITVTAEIKIDLEHIGNGSQPCSCPIDGTCRCTKKIVSHQSQGIGQENLFTETCRKSADSQGNTVQCHRSLVNFRCHIMILHNRSCDQLWEKGYVEKYFCIVFLGPGCFPVNIDHIRHCLKGKERNTDRHANLRQRQMKPCHTVDHPQDKICILKYNKDSQIADHCQNQDSLPVILEPVNPAGTEIIQ